MSIRCFIFDWSGTISDDRRVVYAANALMREDYGLPPVPFEAWLATATMTAYEHFVEAGVVIAPDALYAHYERRLDEVIAGGLAPTMYGDAADTLARLTSRGNVRIGLVSSHPQKNLLGEVSAYGLSDRFLSVIGGSRDKASDIARMVGEWDASPKETLYVGDTIHDIRHSKRAGVRSGAITTGYHQAHNLIAEQPDFLFTSLSEIPRALVTVTAKK
jgi:phosphoglycolate phosphatase